MTPAERALLVEIARVLGNGFAWNTRLSAMMQAVWREDAQRPINERMPSESLTERAIRSFPLLGDEWEDKTD